MCISRSSRETTKTPRASSSSISISGGTSRCGAFGDDAPDRNGLLPKAMAAIRACGGPDVAPLDVVVIGDTPLDVACAAASGARSLAVATGGYDAEALRAAGADVVLEDLSDTTRSWRRSSEREVGLPSRSSMATCGDVRLRFADECRAKLWRDSLRPHDRAKAGGSASESNRASPREQGATGFEDRESHRAPFASATDCRLPEGGLQIDCRFHAEICNPESAISRALSLR